MKLSEANVTCGPSGSRRLPVRSGVSNGIGSGTTRVVCSRFGIAYMSDGSEARPGETRSRRVPISWEISTLSCSL